MGTTISVFLELSKGFSTLGHITLIKKIKFYSVKGSALNTWTLMAVYLPCYLLVHEFYKDQLILGSLLFLIYMNDLHEVCKRFTQ